MSDSKELRANRLPDEAFDQALQDRLLGLFAQGLTTERVLRAANLDWPKQWITALCYRSPDFASQYTIARRQGIHAMAEGVIDIAEDEPDTMRAKLRIDATRWYVSKMDPRRYGDSLNLNVAEQISVTDALQQARERVINAQEHTQAIECKEDLARVSTDSQSADAENDLPDRPIPDGLGDLLE